MQLNHVSLVYELLDIATLKLFRFSILIASSGATRRKITTLLNVVDETELMFMDTRWGRETWRFRRSGSRVYYRRFHFNVHRTLPFWSNCFLVDYVRD